MNFFFIFFLGGGGGAVSQVSKFSLKKKTTEMYSITFFMFQIVCCFRLKSRNRKVVVSMTIMIDYFKKNDKRA